MAVRELLKIEDREAAYRDGDVLLSEVWREFLKCRVCNERIGAYALTARTQGLSVESICINCLVKLATGLNEKESKASEALLRALSTVP